MVCSNHMTMQDDVNQVVIHELIHAFDDCRAANLDWANCAHHACSEVRSVVTTVSLFWYFVWWSLSNLFALLSVIIYAEQIRAGHLSGDCHYKREFLRGFMKIRGHEQVSSPPSLVPSLLFSGFSNIFWDLSKSLVVVSHILKKVL